MDMQSHEGSAPRDGKTSAQDMSSQRGRPPASPPCQFSIPKAEELLTKRGVTKSVLRREIADRFSFSVSIMRIFGGKCQPSYYAIYCIAKVLEVPMEALLEERAEEAA
jgi:hypothetical protein